ncbi:MAG: DNA-binding response regulator [Calditrichaeota bacterium]|nr:MAG: DNA-binding response regulator [Calditrichota bacterium]MBL1204457.1 DNA-binding response regulator [Calditrichota bacterium]NOG44286.1 response regulator transcription factor [Calditrichota bacterium]
MEKKVLIIEDDPDIGDLLELHLKDLDLNLDRAEDGELGLSKALDSEYELVILDVMLPKLNGLDVCKKIREHKKSMPILMLTAKSEEFDKVLGLELGADDYLTKPFSIRELIARIKAIIRRVNAVIEEQVSSDVTEISFGWLNINMEKRRVLLNGENIELTAKEFDLLALFAANPGKAYTRENLLNIVWGYQFTGYEHTVNSHINRLRSKIETDPAQPKFIKTVWGVGYKFAEHEDFE